MGQFGVLGRSGEWGGAFPRNMEEKNASLKKTPSQGGVSDPPPHLLFKHLSTCWHLVFKFCPTQALRRGSLSPTVTLFSPHPTRQGIVDVFLYIWEKPPPPTS